jgi:paired small multidrug resistance pump
MNYYWHDIVGNIGAVIILVSYMLMQMGRLKNEGLWYSILNIIGSICIVLSLSMNFNLSAFVIEICWLVLSIVGLLRCFYLRKKKVRNNNAPLSMPGRVLDPPQNRPNEHFRFHKKQSNRELIVP